MPRSTAFADDLRRYLRHEPISARPRHARVSRRAGSSGGTRGGVAARLPWSLLVAALTALYTSRLAAERDRAQREAAKAVKVSELLMGLLTSADPYAIRGDAGEPTVRALLDAGAEQVQKELAGEPELQAEMLTTMGRTYRRLGVVRQGAAAARAGARERTSRSFGAEHARVGADARLPRRRARRQRRLRRAGHAASSRRWRCGGSCSAPQHPDVAVTLVGARTRLPGSGIERARRAAAPRGAGDPAEGARRPDTARPPSA